LSKYLAKALEKYYSRDGKKIVFANGMTLNQLAWEMWEKLGFTQIDPSVISRVIRGQRQFTSTQLKTFCSLLNLGPQETNKLISDRLQDLYEKYGLDQLDPQFGFNSVVDYAQMVLPVVKKLRESGFQNLSYDLSSELIDHLCEKRDFISLHPTLLSTVLFEKVAAVLDTQPARVLQTQTTQPLKILFQLGKESKNNEIIGLAYYLKGNVYYNLGNHSKSYLLHQQALKYLPRGFYRPFSLRSYSISSAELGLISESQKAQTQLLAELPEQPLDMKAVIYEGLVRTNTILKSYPQIYKYMDYNWDIVNQLEAQKGPNWVFRKIQLIRTQTDLALKIPLDHKNYIMKKAKQGLELADKYNFYKYTLLIKNSMSSL
jgi:tetratricopeptide (TPR) repeat protein